MTPQQARSYLDSFINYELRPEEFTRIEFKLTRVERLLEKLGSPHRRLKTIHIAGTKGKGSTSAMTAHILREAGYRVGLYTSPHLNDYTERIRILAPRGSAIKSRVKRAAPEKIFHDAIDENALAACLKAMRPSIEAVQSLAEFGRLTFFEVFTALALYYFDQHKVDFAVLETGMGGRLDATNVTTSLVAAITSISLEHTHMLGDTVSKIAGEKAGIIKHPSQSVVLAEQDQDALRVLKQRCRELGITPVCVGKDVLLEKPAVKKGRQVGVIRTAKNSYQVSLPLLGHHQLINAATAVGIIECLKTKKVGISIKAVEKGLRSVVWPGRFECICQRPLTMVDCAHNPSSAEALARTVKSQTNFKQVILVLGVSKDKDIAGICRALDAVVSRVVATRTQHPRAHTFKDQEMNLYFSDKPFEITETVDEAMKAARGHASAGDCILVTGSVFVVGEARRLCVTMKD